MTGTQRSRDSLEVLLRLAELGQRAGIAMRKVSDGHVPVGNVTLSVLSSLELHGTMRPSEIVELTGLTSGGVTKVVSRLERSGLVTRTHGMFPRDKRGIAVSLTDEGHDVALRFGDEFADQLEKSEDLIEYMRRMFHE